MWADAFAGLAAGLADGPFVDATLTWPGVPVLDDGGSVATPGTPVSTDCKVQVDAATEEMRADADFQQTDVRLLILSSGLSVTPDEAASVVIAAGVNAGVYALQSVARDPAGIGFECRARLVPGSES